MNPQLQLDTCQDRIPYTYLIIHNKTGLKYYGVRFARGCAPDDLMTRYWTSSNSVKKLIDKDGISSFSVFIRKTFDSVNKAREWETKVLRRLKAATRPDFLNQTDNISIAPRYGIENSSTRPEVKEKISNSVKQWALCNPSTRLGVDTPNDVKEKQRLAKLGSLNPFFNKRHTDATKTSLSENQQGEKNSFYNKKHTEASKQKMSQAGKGVSKPRILCPHCGKEGATHTMYRWHFSNCKLIK